VPVFRQRVSRGQGDGSLRLYSQFSRLEPLFFLPSSSIVLTRLSGLRSRTTTSHKIWWCWESKLDIWICSQEFCPIDHRGGQWIQYILPKRFYCTQHIQGANTLQVYEMFRREHSKATSRASLTLSALHILRYHNSTYEWPQETVIASFRLPLWNNVNIDPVFGWQYQADEAV
jgi:hypothetical protein